MSHSVLSIDFRNQTDSCFASDLTRPLVVEISGPKLELEK